MEIKKKKKKPRKNETKLKTIYPKNYEYFNSKFRVQFYWPYFFVIIIYFSIPFYFLTSIYITDRYNKSF